MSMKSPQSAVCGNTSCTNNENGAKAVVCSACGKCAACTFHDGCASTTEGLVAPVVAICGNTSCSNNFNGRLVLVCTNCGKCVGCMFHSHGGAVTVHGRPEPDLG